MLTTANFKKGDTWLKSSFYDKNYYEIELVKITKIGKTKRLKGHFWFDAKIINEYKNGVAITEKDYSFKRIGTVSSFSESGVAESLEELSANVANQKVSSLLLLLATI